MASQTKPRPPGQHKKKRKDAGPEKHDLNLGNQMELNLEALPPKCKHLRNRNCQQGEDEYVTPVMSNQILGEARRQQLKIDNEREQDFFFAEHVGICNDRRVECFVVVSDAPEYNTRHHMLLGSRKALGNERWRLSSGVSGGVLHMYNFSTWLCYVSR